MAGIEERIPVSKAARRLNLDTKTMKRLLAEFSGLHFPSLGRGRSPLVRMADVRHVIRKLEAQPAGRKT